MREILRSLVVPTYLFLCILLGGSAQGIWGNMALQLIAIAIISCSLLTSRSWQVPQSAKSLIVIAVAALVWMALQLVPLPPSLWQALPGRMFVADGFALLGQDAPWLPISLAQHKTVETVVTLLPPLAVLTAMLIARAYRPAWLLMAVLLGTLAGILLGTLQVSSPDPTQSSWYLYRRTNYGVATGFFANSNHMATLLVVALAFLAALVAELRKRAQGGKAGSAVLLLAGGGIVTLAIGILLNGSAAAILLGVPVALISGVMVLAPNRRVPGALIALASGLVVSALYFSPVRETSFAQNTASFEARQRFWSTTMSGISENWLTGTGVGSFPTAYPRNENAAEVTRTVVNHAHNDYLEIAFETGVPGILLLVAFLAWWTMRASALWRSPAMDRFAQGAVIASAVMLVHSLVDYPLRTAALSTIFASCLALMTQPRLRDPGHAEDLWPTRHLTA